MAQNHPVITAMLALILFFGFSVFFVGCAKVLLRLIN